MRDNINKTIEGLGNLKEAIEKAAENDVDVQAGDISKEDLLKEPGYSFYYQLVETNKEIFEDPTVQDSIIQIGKSTSPEVSQAITQLLAVCMAVSANNAIALYDDVLTENLNSTLKDFYDIINRCMADVKAHTSVLEVFRNRLSKLEEKNNIEQVTKDMGLSEDDLG